MVAEAYLFLVVRRVEVLDEVQSSKLGGHGFSLEVPAGLRSSRSYGCSGW